MLLLEVLVGTNQGGGFYQGRYLSVAYMLLTYRHPILKFSIVVSF